MLTQGSAGSRKSCPNQRMKLTGAAILVSRGMKVLQAAPAAYPYRSSDLCGPCKRDGGRGMAHRLDTCVTL